MGTIAFAWGWTQYIMGIVLPWWSYAAAGMAGAIALFLLLPAGVPTTLRQFLAMTALCVGVCVSAYSMGRHEGQDFERELWTRKIEHERARLAEGFTDQLTKEQRRAQEAEQAMADLRKQIEEISKDADKVTKPDDIAVPEPIARSLSNLRPRYSRDRR